MYEIIDKIKDFGICGIYLLLAISGMTLIKMGNSIDENHLFEIVGIGISFRLLAGLMCYGLSFVIFSFYISRLQISLVLPILSAINSVGILIVGLIVFGEKLSHIQMIGVITIIIGAFIIGVAS